VRKGEWPASRRPAETCRDACAPARGIGAALLDAAESFARAERRSLLVLDTEAQSAAERVYQRHGWHRVGEIPTYAARTDGQLWATAYYYKQLA
jgi:ribosomal protein S18 acetylase RimI-like enzyme